MSGVSVSGRVGLGGGPADRLRTVGQNWSSAVDELFGTLPGVCIVLLAPTSILRNVHYAGPVHFWPWYQGVTMMMVSAASVVSLVVPFRAGQGIERQARVVSSSRSTCMHVQYMYMRAAASRRGQGNRQ